MTSRLRHLALFAGLGLLLAACSMEVGTLVQADGSGTLRSSIGFTATDQRMLEESELSVQEFCDGAREEGDLPEGTTVEVTEHDDQMWCDITIPFADLDELQELYDEMEGVTVNELAIADGVFTYDVDIDMAQGTSEFSDVEIAVTWQVTMPGRVVSHNADDTQGTTLRWDASSNSINAQASSTVTGGTTVPGLAGLPAWLPGALIGACCCFTLLGAGGAGAFVYSRRNKPTAM